MDKTAKFNVGQPIFIKKYKGNYLAADTSRTYEICSIGSTIYDNQSSSYIKTCILDNGYEQTIYTCNMDSKIKIFYIEQDYTFSYLCCCCI